MKKAFQVKQEFEPQTWDWRFKKCVVSTCRGTLLNQSKMDLFARIVNGFTLKLVTILKNGFTVKV